MYQVIYKDGLESCVIDLPTKQAANNEVIEMATELNLTIGYDADGYAWASDDKTQEIFIFQII